MPAQSKSENAVAFQFSGMRFSSFGEQQEGVAEFAGYAEVGSYHSEFALSIAPLLNGEWLGRELRWRSPRAQPAVLGSEGFLRELVTRAARLLDTTNFWPVAQEEGGARMAANQLVVPEEHKSRTCISFRHALLSLTSSNWNELWELIERRVDHDRYFEVLGYAREDIKSMLPELRKVFGADWVQARYRRAGYSCFADPLEHEDEGFFPAYHLARTALGAVCRDPGWGYLAEIGSALLTLRGVEGIERLIRQLTKNSGVQHHLCLAAELHERGILSGLEPLSGAGAAKCDLLATLEGKTYQVELKELSSRSPLVQLQDLLRKKAGKLPNAPSHPVVFHVVFKEIGSRDIEFERAFFRQIDAISGKIPPKISAVVSGRRFADAAGGRVKHDINAIILNDDAHVPANRSHLEALFQANYTEAIMPFFGVTSFFIFGPRPSDLEPEV